MLALSELQQGAAGTADAEPAPAAVPTPAKGPARRGRRAVAASATDAEPGIALIDAAADAPAAAAGGSTAAGDRAVAPKRARRSTKQPTHTAAEDSPTATAAMADADADGGTGTAELAAAAVDVSAPKPGRQRSRRSRTVVEQDVLDIAQPDESALAADVAGAVMGRRVTRARARVKQHVVEGAEGGAGGGAGSGGLLGCGLDGAPSVWAEACCMLGFCAGPSCKGCVVVQQTGISNVPVCHAVMHGTC